MSSEKNKQKIINEPSHDHIIISLPSSNNQLEKQKCRQYFPAKQEIFPTSQNAQSDETELDSLYFRFSILCFLVFTPDFSLIVVSSTLAGIVVSLLFYALVFFHMCPCVRGWMYYTIYQNITIK